MNLSRKIIGAKMTSALAVAALLTFGGSVSHANDKVQQISSANQAVMDGRLDEALAQYDSAEQAMPGSPLLAYNKGVALYRQGQRDQARQSFAAALDADDPELVAKASFNLGNCHYASAVQQSESEGAAVIESLQTAIAHYRSALLSNPADTDCRANIELAQQLIQKLKQEQEQDQQQQDQQQNQEQSENQESENQESQNQDSENTDSNESEQDQSDQSESQSGKQGEQESDENRSDENESDEKKPDQESKSVESQSEDQGEKEKQSDQNSSGSDSEEKDQKQTDQENSAGSKNEDQQPPDQQPEQQADQQSQPGEEQQEAQPEPKPGQEMQVGTAGEQDQNAGDEQSPGYAVSQPGKSGESIDKQEAMKMLQAIRDRDLMRRMQKLNEARRNHRPVDRDW